MKQFYSFENEQGDFSICYGDNEDDSESMVVCAVDDWHKETVIMLNSIIEKLRIEYEAELEAFKRSFATKAWDEFEDKLNQATHADASEITSLRKELDKRDESIKNLIKINERLNREIEGPDDGLNASHREEDSPRNSGWSV